MTAVTAMPPPPPPPPPTSTARLIKVVERKAGSRLTFSQLDGEGCSEADLDSEIDRSTPPVCLSAMRNVTSPLTTVTSAKNVNSYASNTLVVIAIVPLMAFGTKILNTINTSVQFAIAELSTNKLT